MKTITTTTLIATLMLGTMSGCFREHRDTVQTADIAGLVFAGEVEGTTFQLVDKAEEPVTEPFEAAAGTRYAVPTGTAILIVRRGEAVVVKRKLYFVSGQTREVRIP